MNEITFDVLKIVVSICAALITVYVIPYIKTLKEDKRYASLVDIVEVAVRAAEQNFKQSGSGAAKKDEVMTFVRDWMAHQGIEIRIDQLDQLVECCVYELRQERK